MIYPLKLHIPFYCYYLPTLLCCLLERNLQECADWKSVTFCLFQLYFDLEFRKADQVSKINGDLMLAKFKEFLETDLCKVSFPQLIDKIEVIDLDSSTHEKFSHHLIVNMYHENDPVLFPDNLQGI